MHKATTSTHTSEAPNSAHIMWVKPTAFGGQVGLPISGDQESQYTSTSILYRQFEPIILNGVIFYKLYPNVPTTVTSAAKPQAGKQLTYALDKLLWQKTPTTHWSLAGTCSSTLYKNTVHKHS